MTAPEPAPRQRRDVFVSYAREDVDFVRRRLCAELERRGKSVWVDFEAIPPASAWEERIAIGIESARAFVFVLSPDSLASGPCRDELDSARALNKRLIPVVRRDVEDTLVPPDLRRYNWIFLREADDFAAGCAAVVDALETDLEWRDQHTNLAGQAGEWLAQDRDTSFLLRGRELSAAERWLTDQAGHAEAATAEQTEFIVASRQATTRRRGLTLTAVIGALGVSVVLAVLALLAQQRAVDREQLARSRELAATAVGRLDTDPELSLRLALAAVRSRDTDEAGDALRRSLLAASWLHLLHAGGERVLAAEPNARATRIVVASGDPTVEIWAPGSRRRLTLRHPRPARAAALSPDGRWAVTGCDDGRTRLWDARNGRLERALGGRAPVRRVAVTRDGATVLSATQTGRARVWRPATGRTVTLAGAGGPPAGSTLSPDGRLLVTRSGERGASVWSTVSGDRLARLDTGGVLTRTASFSPDGRRIVTADSRGIARVWSAPGGRLEATMARTAQGGLTSAVFSPDGRRVLAAGNDGYAVLFDARRGGIRVAWRHPREINDAAFSADGARVVTAGEDGVARVWSVGSGRRLAAVSGHTAGVTVVALGPDGRRLLTAADDGTVRVWNADGRGVIPLTGGRGGAVNATFSPDGRRVVASSARGPVGLWSVATGRHEGDLVGSRPSRDSPDTLPCGSVLGCRPFSADGRRVAVVGDDGGAGVWALAGRATARRLPPVRDDFFTSVAFAPRGSRAVATTDSGVGLVWDDPETRRRIRLQAPADEFVAFAPDGERLVAADLEGRLRLFDAGDGRVVATMRHGGVIWSARFAPGGRRLVTTGEDGRARLWDIPSGRASGRLGDSGRALYDAAFSADGHLLVTGGADETARVYDARERTPLGVLRGHTEPLTKVSFSPDGRLVASSAGDGRDAAVRLSDWRRERTLVVLPKAGGPEFSPRDAAVVVTVVDGEPQLYRCEVCGDTGQLVRAAESREARALTPAERRAYLDR